MYTNISPFKLAERIVLKSTGAAGKVTYVYSSGAAVNVRLDGALYDAFVTNNEIAHAPVATVAAEPAPQEPTVTTTPSINAYDTFVAAASKALVKVARKKKNFTTDDLYAAMPSETHGDARLMGAFMAEAKKSNSIVVTKRFKRSARTGGPLRVWKSLIHAGK